MNISGMDTGDVLRLLDDYYSIANTLRRRGLQFGSADDDAQVIGTSDAFYAHMKSASYRKILRHISANPTVTRGELLNRFTDLTAASLDEKLQEMSTDGAIAMAEDVPRARDGKKYGVTFEWFVAEIFKRQMSGIASFGVRVLELPTGGDYDVLARLEDVVVFVECKSGAIEALSASDLTNFIARTEELRPDVAIFALDRSGLTDGFSEVCKAADWKRWGYPSYGPKLRSASGRGTFHQLASTRYVVTSEGNLISNVRLAINHFFTFVKPYGMVGPSKEKIASHYDEFEA